MPAQECSSPISKSANFNSPFGRSLVQNDLQQGLSALSGDELELESGPIMNSRKRAEIERFVDKAGGKRVIQRILIANNGMAATKAILSIRQWAYITFGDASGRVEANIFIN